MQSINHLLIEILSYNIPRGQVQWLKGIIKEINHHFSDDKLTKAFSEVTSIVWRTDLYVKPKDEELMEEIIPGFKLHQWSSTRLARVIMLSELPSENKSVYINSINDLFDFADMNELAALYSSLPFLAYPEAWKFKCTQGIRTNIGIVLDAIIYYNPYPAKYLSEDEWNQMICKAFFNNKIIDQITGVDERGNLSLSVILTDYANERKAAHRDIDNQIWRLIAPFMNETSYRLIEKFFNSNNPFEVLLAAFACSSSSYPPAKELLQQNSNILQDFENKQVTWSNLNNKLYVLQ